MGMISNRGLRQKQGSFFILLKHYISLVQAKLADWSWLSLNRKQKKEVSWKLRAIQMLRQRKAGARLTHRTRQYLQGFRFLLNTAAKCAEHYSTWTTLERTLNSLCMSFFLF